MSESEPGAGRTGGSTASATIAKPFSARFTAPLLLGSTLNPINTATIATALVGIGVDFHVGPTQTASLISVLYLVSSVAQPTVGKLANLFGPRRVFLVGAMIMTLAGIVGAAAPSFGWLLVSRGLIGLGSSAAFPTAMSLIRSRADAAGQGVPSRVIGNLSIAGQVCAVIGLPLGGVLTGVWGWRAIFAINIPLAIITLVLSYVGVPKDAPLKVEGAGQVVRHLDIPGIALFAATILSLLQFLSSLSSPAWWLLAAFLVFGAALILWERRAASPLINVRALAKNPTLLRTYGRTTMTYLATYAVLYGVSQWMEEARGLSASQVGLIMIPLTGISIVLARLASTRGWIRGPLLLTGIAMLGAAVVTLFITHSSPIWLLISMTLLIGLVNGFAGFANQAALYLQAPAEEIAVASGLMRTATYLGSILSSAIIGIVFGQKATDGGLHSLGWVLAGLGAVLLLFTALDRRIPWRAAK